MTIDSGDGQTIDELAGLLEGTPGQDSDFDAEPPADDQQEHEEGHTDSHEEPSDEQDTGNADDATDPADEEQPEGDEDRGETESDTGTPEPLYPVKIGDKEERVTLKEALAGYQRNADYTRKTQQVAEERKALDAHLQEARAQRDQYAQVLQVLQQRIGSPEGERTEAQWAELRNSDPAAYATEYADFQRRQDARSKIKAEQDRVASEQQAERLNNLKAVVAEQGVKLREKLPILGDKVEGPKALAAIRNYAVQELGFSEQEANQAYDHRLIVAIEESRLWRAHQAALEAAKGKLKGARVVPPPAARQPQNARTRKAADQAAAQKRFDKSGRIEDAVDLI